MRALARCGTCQRQWDAGTAAPGERIRCACGALVLVPSLAEAHRHLRALHCGTCGAARRDDRPACAFCGAAFRAEDLRRDTVCPGCYARIADDARFCDHCGLAITAQPIDAGEPAAGGLPCPLCGPEAPLRHRRIGSVGADECRRCGGLWLETAVFDDVVTRARSASVPDLLGDAPPPRPAQPPKGPLYRPCPRCGGMMNRANYGRSSGVVIDTCKAHGAWFDADELARVVAWIRGGGFDRVRAKEAEEDAARKRSPAGRPTMVLPTATDRDTVGRDGAWAGEILDTAIDLLAAWWRRS